MTKSMIALGLAALAAAAATRVVADDANPPTEHAVLAQRLDLAKGERHAFAVHAPKLPPGRHPYLFFRAAAQSANPAGYCNRAIQVLVNDQPIDAQRLSNRPSTATMLNGHVLTAAQGNGCFLIPWGPDFPAEYKTLTEHMYPTTPIEIHAGYVIARERILTNRSGLFGWGDDGDFIA
jgi:hypothetical protein